MSTILDNLRDLCERRRQSRWRTATYISLFVAGATLSPFSSALADPRFDWEINGVHVTSLEASYIPNYYSFTIDGSANAACPVGMWLTGGYGQGGANVEAVYSLLLAAKLTQTLSTYMENCLWRSGRIAMRSCVYSFGELRTHPRI
jgi:hypothetical protein